MAKHIKEVEFQKDFNVYMLEIDTEDKDNLVIESVTYIGTESAGEKKIFVHGGDLDQDPEVFTEELDIDDWQRIKEALK